jgi:alpha-tubulin suppressor-like RCC1 family protein
MPTFYNFTENGVVYSFDDVFVPADLFRDGNLFTWGLGTSGQLGNAVTTDRLTPITTFAGGTNWKQVIAGGSHTAAIKTDGSLWTWGGGSSGQLGNNSIAATSTPVTTFVGGTDWKQVSGGSFHTAAIKTDGTLWTWGNEQGIGRIPVIRSTNTSTPITTFAGGTNWADTATTEPEDLYTLSAGFNQTSAIKTDGTLWAWGGGSSGQLGNNSIVTTSTPVTTFAGGTNWKQVSGGSFYTAAIKTDGTLWTWGSGSYGRLGNDLFTGNRLTPITTFAGGTNWKQVSAALSHTAAIKTDGTLWTWGNGNSGRLGNAVTTNRLTPVTTFAGGTNWKQVSCGGGHIAAIKTDGTLWAWGLNNSRQLGNASTSFAISTPVTTFAGGTNWKQVSAGFNQTSAIKTDGTLWTWGNGSSGRLGNAVTTNISTPVTTFAGGTNWKQVSCGDQHTAAIKTDGTLWTWGNGGIGRLGNAVTTGSVSTPVTTFAGGTNWKQVSCGNSHTVALKDDGVNKELWGWGNSTNYELGDFVIVPDDRTVPKEVSGNSNNWKQVSAGNNHTAAIKTDGTLWTWGNGNSGRLGNAVTTGNISTPVTTFAGGTDWKQVSAGGAHISAIKTDGTLWTWGNGNFGRLGNNDTTDRSTPVTTFAGGTNWKQVSAGYSHTSAIKTDGTLWTWGNGSSGRLGREYTSKQIILTPVTTFAGGTNWADTATTEPEDLYTLSAGYSHTSAIKTDGTLWTWGNGSSGRLGNAVTTNISTPVTTFAGGTNWKQVSVGFNQTSAIKTDGTLWTWGNGNFGSLGNGLSTGDRLTPITTFAGGTNWKQVSAGGSHTAAIKTDGTLWTWGSGSSGVLGNAAISLRSTPVTTFAGGTNWKQVSAGNNHTAAIKTDGTLWNWGSGADGRLGINNTTQRITPVTTFAGGTDWKQVSCGFFHTAAIKTDGTLWAWGLGDYGRLGNGLFIGDRSTPVTTFAGGTNWKQVGCGGQHTAAIKTDGTLWTWGKGDSGELGKNNQTTGAFYSFTPVTTFAGGTNWKQVSCGGDHTVALKDDGVNKELYVWGNNTNYELGTTITIATAYVPNQVNFSNNWKQVSSGFNNTSAVKTDGTLWTWGNSYSGQLGINSGYPDRFTPVTTFAGGTNWKQVSVVGSHTAALTYQDPGI